MARSSPEPTIHRTLRPTLCADLSDLPGPIAWSARALASKLHAISMRRCLGTSAQELRVTHSSLYGHHAYSAGQWPDVCLAYCLGQIGTSHFQVQGLPLVSSPTLTHSSLFQPLTSAPYTHLQHTCMMTHFGHLPLFWH